MTGEELRRSLQAGERAFGTVLFYCRRPRLLHALRPLKFDFVVVDAEHAPMDRAELADLMLMLAYMGTVPMVRIPTRNPEDMAMALDAGAQGVLVPYCEEVTRIKELVATARWRPLKGQRLKEVIESNQFVTPGVKQVLEGYNRNAFVVIGVESVPAVERLEEILSIEGVDSIFVGTHDLSVSMGYPGELLRPEVVRMFRRILKACAAHRVPAGIWPLPLELAAYWVKQGMRFVLHSTDDKAMVSGFEADFAVLRSIGTRSRRRRARA